MRAAEAFDPGEEPACEPAPGSQAGRIARSTAFFSVATAASRDRRPRPGSGRRRLLRRQRPDVGLHDRLPGPEPDPRPVRRRGPAAGLRPRLHRTARRRSATSEAFRLASTLLLLVTMVLGAITALFVLLAPVIMPALRARVPRPAPRPHGHPLPGPLPDPDPARDQRRRRRHPQQLRPLRRLRDLAAVLEPDDHRRAGRPRAALRTAQDRIYAYAIGILVGTLVQLLIPAWDLRHTPFQLQLQPRLAPPRRAAGAAADAAGDDQPRPDQLQPADQQLLRQPRHRRSAGGDRQSVPHLPAAAGDLLGRDRDGPVPDPGPLRQRRRDRQPAGDDGERDAPDPLRPGAGGGGDPRPLGTDDPPRLPARRIQPGGNDAGRARRSSGSPSRCRPTASTCCRRGPSSASSGPGGRRRWR